MVVHRIGDTSRTGIELTLLIQVSQIIVECMRLVGLKHLKIRHAECLIQGIASGIVSHRILALDEGADGC